MRVGEYYRLVKPGEVYGNSLTAIAGFLVGADAQVVAGRFLALLFGLGLVMAGCLVINNWIDRGIDQKMTRTQDRALAKGSISVRSALIFAAVLLSVGFFLLSFTGWLTVAIAATGLIDYLVLYSLAKRRTSWSTVVGSVSGAVPIAAGYTAATGRLDAGAWLLFALMAIWQMPHFYTIGMFRREEYAAAGLPILPVRKGLEVARRRVLWYMAAYLPAVLLLSVLGYTGRVFGAVMGIVALAWLVQGLALRSGDKAAWARRVFRSCMLVLLCFCIMLSLNPYLP